jgi:diacylglycerol kinase family enzyme
MGTGNDGSDAWKLDDALDLFIEPVNIEYQKALILHTSSKTKGPFFAFNILSLGVDAFITHMTNKMKGSLPGDSYKLWVDIAALFYDRLYKVKPITVKAFDKGKEVIHLHEKALLTAMGESGHRTYGSHKHILPDDRNACFIRQMPLLKKISFKERFNTGSHVGQAEAVLFHADKIEFCYDYPILAQMDGETVLLEPNDFPVNITVSEPLIPILKRV